MPSIKSIHIEGFRSLKDVTLEPGRVTVLIGPNGAGKSNVLGALRLLDAINNRLLRIFVGRAGGASTLLHYGPSETPELKLAIEMEDAEGAVTYVAGLIPTLGDQFVFSRETGTEAGENVLAGHDEGVVGDRAAPQQVFHVGRTRRSLAGIQGFHFHDTSATAPLLRNSRQEDVRSLHRDGGNLAAYLYLLANGTSDAYRAAWTRINMLVRRVAPFIRELVPTLVAPDQADRSAVRLNWIDATGAVFAAHQLSDGTLRAIALFTALGQPAENLPAFITIDEPELGLHPEAIALLAGMIRSISSHCQVLIATQSPQFLDELSPEDVVVAERRDNQTVLTRLDPVELAVWMERYSLSQIWEKNLIGGTP